MTELEIIARVYDILARCSHKDLLATANSPGLPLELRRSLEYLAEARKLHSGPRSRQQKMKPRSSSETLSVYDTAIDDAIHDTRRFPSNATLTAFLNKFDLKVSFNDKDGRKRMVKKLLRILREIPPKQREVVVRRVVGAEHSETAGWFQAIRGDRN